MKAIVVVARDLQLDALGCYGNPWIETPALDGLAAQGIVFDQHLADSADSPGARRSWRTGRYYLPTLSPNSNAPVAADLIPVLRERGIHTCLIVDESQPSPDEFAIGWDEVQRVGPAENMSALEATLEAAGAALERLEQRDDWLLWIDLATLVPPWNVPEEFQTPYFNEEPIEDDEEEDESVELEALTSLMEPVIGPIDPEDDTLYLRLHASYAAAVSYLDSALGELLQALEGLEGAEEILLLLTTDIGPSLGEHGVIGLVAGRLHEEILHLPLLLRLPGDVEAGRRVPALTQAVDVAATLADHFHAPLPEAHGHSLLPLARGEIETIRSYACAGRRIGTDIEYALRTPDWAFLLSGGTKEGETVPPPQLYVKPDDRCEVNDVVQHHLDLAERLERTLRDFVTASCQSGPFQPPPLPESEGPPGGAADAALAGPVSE